LTSPLDQVKLKPLGGRQREFPPLSRHDRTFTVFTQAITVSGAHLMRFLPQLLTIFQISVSDLICGKSGRVNMGSDGLWFLINPMTPGIVLTSRGSKAKRLISSLAE
jgi:hypothetical protein